MKKTNEAMLEKMSVQAETSMALRQELYARYNVKRGLRDVNGKGVLAGLTRIGEVQPHYPEDDPEGVGRLVYRGIGIDDLVEGFLAEDRFGFEEIVYLLLFGALPRRSELARFEEMLADYRTLPAEFIHDRILKQPGRDIMNAIARGVLAMYLIDERAESTAVMNVLRESLQLIAAFPLLLVYSFQAYAYHYKNKSLVIHSPRRELSTAENFLQMLRDDSDYSRLEAKLLDLCLVLHAEHGGGNNSTFVTHVVTSSGTDTYSAMAAALGSLKGPRHGGANIKVLRMFEDIKGHVRDWSNEKQIERYLLKIVRKKAFDRTGLIYGVGHAVYSVSDPRSIVLKRHVQELAREKGMEEEFGLYAKVEELAPEIIANERKIYKGVCVNVDFYSGFLYRMLEIPPELFTPLFAMARIAGWSAHRLEEIVNSGKIIRPAYKGVARARKYVPLNTRK